jgi:hypothetical protein
MAARVLRYGSEDWALTRFERMKIERGEMGSVRRIPACKLTDHVHNAIIPRELQICFNRNNPRL